VKSFARAEPGSAQNLYRTGTVNPRVTRPESRNKKRGAMNRPQIAEK